MRKALVVAMLVMTALTNANTAMAGSIDYLTNQSADYIRAFSRNAAFEGADIATFNPAGTAWLDDGLYLYLSSQTLFKEYTITYKGDEYAATDPTWALPSFFAIYKVSDFAVFGSFTVPAGGGSLTYEDGVPFLQALSLAVAWPGTASFLPPEGGYFEGSSMYLAPTLGASYRLLDIVSFSAAARALIVTKTYKGHATYTDPSGTQTRASLDAEKKGFGVGGIFGLDLHPFEGFNIAMRYEMKTPLELETTSTLENINTTTSSGDPNALESYADGAKEDRDLPAVLGVGMAYRILEELNVSVSGHYYFITAADAEDDVEGPTGYTKSYDDDYEDGYDVATSVEYRVIPELLLSVGYIYAKIGGNIDTYSDFEFATDSNSVGFGGRYSALENLDVTFGVSGTFYGDEENETLHPFLGALPEALTGGVEAETFSKQVYDIALGLEWKVL